MVKVVIENQDVKVYDSDLARKGVSAEQILARDKEKMEQWNSFMKDNPSEREIANELESDFVNKYGFNLAKEVVK